jgi:hypothetical protein
MSPKIIMLAPGEDPTTREYKSSGPSCSGWLIKAGVVLTLIIGALWLFFQSRPQPRPAEALVVLPSQTATATLTTTSSGTPTLLTSTPSRSATPVPLPTNTPVTPTPTQRFTETGTPERWGNCTIGEPILSNDCITLNDSPWYSATFAMAQYQTQVAPLTPSHTPTRTQTPTRTATPAKKITRGGSGAGGSGSGVGAAAQSLPGANFVVPYATAIPPIRATLGPTFTPPPNCSGMVFSFMSNDPNQPLWQITSTPIPECVGRQPTTVPGPTMTATAQEMYAEIPTETPVALPVSETPTPSAVATADATLQQ